MPDTADDDHDAAARLLTLLPRLQHVLKRDRLRIENAESAGSILSDRRGQYHLLSVLLAHGPTTTQHLADRLEVSTPTVSTMIRQLAEHGLVTRERDRDDQRVVWVAISETGREAVEEERRLWRTVFLDRFEQLDAADQRRIAEAVPALERLLGAGTHRCDRREG